MNSTLSSQGTVHKNSNQQNKDAEKKKRTLEKKREVEDSHKEPEGTFFFDDEEEKKVVMFRRRRKVLSKKEIMRRRAKLESRINSLQSKFGGIPAEAVKRVAELLEDDPEGVSEIKLMKIVKRIQSLLTIKTRVEALIKSEESRSDSAFLIESFHDLFDEALNNPFSEAYNIIHDVHEAVANDMGNDLPLAA